ncbi:YkuJ family protein [Vagococcus allomyrinae]|uniref:YkuJ family protein n=1 Tax=Vagococcus allomyrinae TaxID=2794353 RepID=A0A940SWL6_9ENTE|nr:YkuJ family protein [Vagococcus allomyrinae]MBP1041488.1 YkuJ family protein [Vagococcus allomyrinae]
MKHSQLVAIIKRLEAMIEASATDKEIQVRRFEREGNERCIVTYDSANEMFELTESDTQQVYQFDDIDLVAIEIYELLQA